MADDTVMQVRRQQQVEELCIASIRALAGQADLHFRARRLHRGSRRLPRFAQHLQPSLEADDFGSFRGAADGLALRLLHSDGTLHTSLQPADAAERLLFDVLEQFRCEALADAAHAGVRHNLRHRFEAWSLQFHRSEPADTARGLLLYTLLQMARARVGGEPVLEATEDWIEATRVALAPVIGVPLAALKRCRHDQAAYAQHALEIARSVGSMLAGDTAGGRRRVDDPGDPERAAFSLLADLDGELQDDMRTADAGNSRALSDAAAGYHVFTRAYDRTLAATTLLRPALLAAHREQLDRRIATQGVNLARLTRALQQLLALPVVDGWDGAQEQGRIDASRLAQLVASPAERRLFRSDHVALQADTALTLLVDCSGSMKAHAEAVATLADILLRAADLAGVTTELLGFSTGAWNGGRAARDWVRAGRPPHPGRLNEVAHLVFKDADTPWRRARRGIAALLEPQLFREGIDGEAVAWAVSRLQRLDFRQRLLLVVSDGCPMDSATERANEHDILGRHLREVVAEVEQRGDVAVFGVGVGLDLSPYFNRSQVIDLAAGPGNAVLADLLQMLGGRRRR